MANVTNFSTDKVDVFLLVLDCSGSMENEQRRVINGLRSFKKSFENFSEAKSIVVAISMFADTYYPGEFKHIEDLNCSYNPSGSTALYYSICASAAQIREYMNYISQQLGIVPRGTLVFFSDGKPCRDFRTERDAKEAISSLNYAGINTVFVAFGESMSSRFGERLGFISTKDVDSSLDEFLGEELSKSCKEQSMSVKALGKDFFSNKINSEPYSNKADQAINDISWIDEI